MNKMCKFGRPHAWTTARPAALNANLGTHIPRSFTWVWWCPTCDAVELDESARRVIEEPTGAFAEIREDR